MVRISKEFVKHLDNFDNKSFYLDLQRKSFIYNITHSDNSLIGAIYSNSSLDINFASAIINTGFLFFPNNLLYGLHNRNYTVLKKHK